MQENACFNTKSFGEYYKNRMIMMLYNDCIVDVVKSIKIKLLRKEK